MIIKTFHGCSTKDFLVLDMNDLQCTSIKDDVQFPRGIEEHSFIPIDSSTILQVKADFDLEMTLHD